MIPAKNTVQVEGIGGNPSRQMSLDLKSLPHIMTVLGNLYSNPILAVIREYSTNAMDSHIAAGKADLPIKVSLPSQMNPTFSVEDFGTGLSEEHIYDIYGSYGASTKRESNDFNGQLGFGCKSAFSYTDQFTVTSTKDGVARTFVFSLDNDGIGEITKMQEALTDAQNGVKVSVPVKLTDIGRFVETASTFYQAWQVFPQGIRNNALTPVLDITTPSGYRVVSYSLETDYNIDKSIVMGNVRYPVPKNVLSEFNRTTSNLYTYTNVLIYVPMGAVQFVPSREELKITPNIKGILVESLEAMRDHVKTAVETEISVSPNYIEACKAWDKLKRRYSCISSSFQRELKYKGFSINSTVILSNKELAFVNTKGIICKYTYGENQADSRTVYVVRPAGVEVIQEKGFVPRVKGWKDKEIRSIRTFLQRTEFNRVILIKSVADVPAENSIIGIPVMVMDDLITKYYVPPIRGSRPRGLGLYDYNPGQRRQIDLLESIDDDDLPEAGETITVVELNGYVPVDRNLHYCMTSELTSMIPGQLYAARSGNMKKIREIYNVVDYADALVAAIEAKIDSQPNSAKAAYDVPVSHPDLMNQLWATFESCKDEILDPVLKRIVEESGNAITEYNAIQRANSMSNAINVLFKFKGEEYVRDRIAKLYTRSLEVEGVKEVFTTYPLLTLLSPRHAKISDVKDYVNALYTHKEYYDSSL